MIHLTNKNNSCYIDSLFTILHNITDVRRLLRNAKTDTARDIRKAIMRMNVPQFRKVCNDTDDRMSDEDWLTDQKEPLDILLFIKNHMNFPTDVRYRETHYLKEATCLKFLKEKLKRSDFFSYKFFTPSPSNRRLTLDTTDTLDNGKVIKHTFVSSPLLMIHINRNQGSSMKDTTEIRVPKTSKCMELAGVIVHIGRNINSGHYIAYFKKKNKWYEYDDLKSHTTPIVGNLKASVFRNCTDVFYVSKNK